MLPGRPIRLRSSCGAASLTSSRTLPVRAVDDMQPAHHPAAEFNIAGERDMRTTLAQVAAVAGIWLACTMGTGAQTAAPPTASDKDQHRISDQDIDMMRKDIRSQKKQLIAQNLKLTDAEATKFWPIYDQYTAE